MQSSCVPVFLYRCSPVFPRSRVTALLRTGRLRQLPGGTVDIEFAHSINAAIGHYHDAVGQEQRLVD